MSESRQATELSTVSCTLRWSIAGLGRRLPLTPNGHCLRSKPFYSPEVPSVRFTAVIYGNGDKASSKGFLSSVLSVEGVPSDGLLAKVSVSLDETTNSAVHDFGAGSEAFGWSQHLRHDKVGSDVVVEAMVEFGWEGRLGGSAEERGPRAELGPYLLSRSLSDARLVVQGRPLPVHRLALAAQSPVFAACFSHSETREGRSGEVVVEEASEAAVRLMLRWLYTGELGDEEAVGTLGEAVGLGQRYQVPGLKAAAETRLFRLLAPDTLPLIAQVADLHDSQTLLQACQQLLSSGRARVPTGKWRDLAQQSPDLLAQLIGIELDQDDK